MLNYFRSHCTIKHCSLLLGILLILSCNSEVQTINICVGEKYRETSKPYFDDIDKALILASEMRSKQETNPITVHVSEGSYYLDTTILITPLLNNITLLGEGADKVIFKGSKKLNSSGKTIQTLLWSLRWTII